MVVWIGTDALRICTQEHVYCVLERFYMIGKLDGITTATTAFFFARHIGR